jgi:DNA-binding transcriptional ArsR family regulator
MEKSDKNTRLGYPAGYSSKSAVRNSEVAVPSTPVNKHLHSAAALAKSLSDGNRLRILLLISSGRKSVSAIVEALNLSQPLVSHHLKELKRSRMVKVQRQGPFIYYELADARILGILQTLREVAADLLAAAKMF